MKAKSIADSVNSVEGVSSRTPIDPTATMGKRSTPFNELTMRSH
jgi:hypothetical protein